MIPHPDDPSTWPAFRPTIIAHDVGRSRDRSTAVVGGISPFQPDVVGIGELEELPVGLYGSARASALAEVDRRHHNNALIVADLSNDATYGEVLHETFGPRVIGLQISRFGDGMGVEWRPVKHAAMPIYTIGRAYLLELYQSILQMGKVKLVDNEMSRRAFEQLANLETEFRESGVVYTCASAQHDDLGISCAMLVWFARHPHLEHWFRNLEALHRPRPRRDQFGWKSFV
jgi:hypothetical protein